MKQKNLIDLSRLLWKLSKASIYWHQKIEIQQQGTLADKYTIQTNKHKEGGIFAWISILSHRQNNWPNDRRL